MVKCTQLPSPNSVKALCFKNTASRYVTEKTLPHTLGVKVFRRGEKIVFVYLLTDVLISSEFGSLNIKIYCELLLAFIVPFIFTLLRIEVFENNGSFYAPYLNN